MGYGFLQALGNGGGNRCLERIVPEQIFRGLELFCVGLLGLSLRKRLLFFLLLPSSDFLVFAHEVFQAEC